MADLDNVLDEIEINDPDDQHRWLNDEDEGESNIQEDAVGDPPRRSAVPSALEAAAARRQQLEDKDLGVGREERDYQASQDDLDEGDEDGEGRALDPDYEQLRTLWISELVCPELFPNNDEIVSVHADLLPEIEESIDELIQQSRQQRQSSRDGHASGELASLMAQISKMDLDRTRFMLVDLARTRMAKIENHALHNRTLVDRMTEQEVLYLKQYGELLEKHYRRTVLSHLPKQQWRKLDEEDMIDTPDLEAFVFCRVLEGVEIDASGESRVLNEDLENDDDEDAANGIQRHEEGACLIAMYKTIRQHVLDGKIELLM
mmetsp:Transcript_37442/g.89699  ORF Transcript_37442/g.89699 Transcript_37442/m.89699 type:complete len:318 (-) Transcript_37442:984-1937(-)